MARGKAHPRRRGLWLRLVLMVLAAFGTAVLLREGLVPPYLNPLPEINLAPRPDAWLIDWRLAGLRRFPAACARVLASPAIDARQIADRPVRDGCGWRNGVSLSAAGDARARYATISCEMAVALALWIKH